MDKFNARRANTTINAGMPYKKNRYTGYTGLVSFRSDLL
jgi:hypothetical protein